ncbi:MAG: beta-N-acetylhexosaminidase [Oceanococcaceae bacterium]
MTTETAVLGPVMGDLRGLQLADDERAWLHHPLIGGVILFARNYRDPQQLAELMAAIRAEREDILVAVDTEGGRVQRCRDGFTVLPPLARFGEMYADQPDHARQCAEWGGWVLGAELAAFDIDLPFAPVLDLDGGVSAIIGDRALHADPDVVADLAAAHMRGLVRGGVATTGKHFPGHGMVAPDSHEELPVDVRSRTALEAHDLRPYRETLAQLDSVMVAHVVYPAVDAQPASFSSRWLQDILRGAMGYDGVIFADDLSMGGAHVQGDIVARAEAAFAAGCDMLPVCNQPDDLHRLLSRWRCTNPERGHARLQALRRRRAGSAPSAQAYAALAAAGLIDHAEPPATRPVTGETP